MTKQHDLNQTRKQITELDNELLSLLAKRRELSLDVARSKEISTKPIRDAVREKELLARLVKQGREQGLDAHYVLSLYQGIIEDSVLNQQAYLYGQANPEAQKPQYSIAFLGAKGSYSYLAATRYCARREVEMKQFGCKSFDEIIQSVEAGHADYGFLPIENTSSGSINEVYDVLQHTSLAIVGETTIEVGHCLLAKPGNQLKDIKTIYAHPQPISQCSRYLSLHPNIKLEYCSSSAEAMDKVINTQSNSVAAIGSMEGGALYQLEAIEKGLANQKINQSRFIVVARKAVDVPEQLPAKCTIIMATGQKAGALVDALLILKAQNLNMSKLESRPIPGTPWEEMFYLDIDANLSSPAMQSALKELEKTTRFIKVLGCYPCESVTPTQLTHTQLLLEPDSSKTEQANLKRQPQQRVSKGHKQEATQVICNQLILGAGQRGALAEIKLPQETARFEQEVKQLKESGFQAVILSNLDKQTDLDRSLTEFKRILQQFNLATVIKVEQTEDVSAVTHHADILMLSGNSMFNPALLTSLGAIHIPVILERSSLASTTEFLQAAEIVLAQGNQQLILCDSGICSMSHPEKISLDLASLVEIKALTHLPIIINPCHGVKDEHLPSFAEAIKQLKADGLIVDIQVISKNKNCGQTQKSISQILQQIYR